MSEVEWKQGQDGWESREYQTPQGERIQESRLKDADGTVFYRDRITPTAIDRWTFRGHSHVDLTEVPPMERTTNSRGITTVRPLFRR